MGETVFNMLKMVLFKQDNTFTINAFFVEPYQALVCYKLKTQNSKLKTPSSKLKTSYKNPLSILCMLL